MYTKFLFSFDWILWRSFTLRGYTIKEPACILVVLLTGLTSCGIYRQNVVNAPLMQQKGQVAMSGHISFNGLEGQAAYALTKKIALLADYTDMGVKKEAYSSVNYRIRKHSFKEIGAGL